MLEWVRIWEHRTKNRPLRESLGGVRPLHGSRNKEALTGGFSMAASFFF